MCCVNHFSFRYGYGSQQFAEQQMAFQCYQCGLQFQSFEEQSHHWYSYHSTSPMVGRGYSRGYAGQRNARAPRGGYHNVSNGTISGRAPQYQGSNNMLAGSYDSSKKKKANPVYCDICQLTCSSALTYNIHVSGKKHISKAKKLSQGEEAPFDLRQTISQRSSTITKEVLHCHICDVSINNVAMWALHSEVNAFYS